MMNETPEDLALRAYVLTSGLRLREKRTHRIYTPTGYLADGRVILSQPGVEKPRYEPQLGLRNDFEPLFGPLWHSEEKS